MVKSERNGSVTNVNNVERSLSPAIGESKEGCERVNDGVEMAHPPDMLRVIEDLSACERLKRRGQGEGLPSS